MNFGDKELIRITKRPRRTTTEIVDIFANDIHIGMFVGLQRIGKDLHFGPTNMNRSHRYRKILNFVFVRLLEYFGMNDLERITVTTPEDKEFYNFLIDLGFTEIDDYLFLSISEESLKKLFSYLSDHPVEIESQVGQIRRVIEVNDPNLEYTQALEMVDHIVEKIKQMDPIGKKFWDNRKIGQINYYLSTATFFSNELEKHEFLESSIKTIVASFDTVNREAYLEEIFSAIDEKSIFPMIFIQILLEKLRKLLPDEIKALNRNRLRDWVLKNMPTWQLSDKIEKEVLAKNLEDAKLVLEDFGTQVKDELVLAVQDLIDHYNGDIQFYGLENRI